MAIFKYSTYVNHYKKVKSILYLLFEYKKEYMKRMKRLRIDPINTHYERDQKMLVARKCRSIFLYLNRHKNIMFGIHNMKFWNELSIKKEQILNELNVIIKNNNYSEEQKKYIKLVIITINKYNTKYGEQIGLCLYRKLGPYLGGEIASYL